MQKQIYHNSRGNSVHASIALNMPRTLAIQVPRAIALHEILRPH